LRLCNNKPFVLSARKLTTTKASARSVTFSADAISASEPPAATQFTWKGAKLGAAAISVAVGLVVHFLIPCPAAVNPQAWTLLAIFLSTITGLVLTPLPVGAWAFLGLSTTVVTKTLTFQQAFSAMTNDVIWLIVLVRPCFPNPGILFTLPLFD
jgi:DASS family divalent anion:Na+ symporter